MTDERIVRLLEEIRDLQKQHAEDYREALRNQYTSVQLQQEWHRMAAPRVRLVLFAVAVVVVAILILVFRIAWPMFR
jgi:hypothetical protein